MACRQAANEAVCALRFDLGRSLRSPITELIIVPPVIGLSAPLDTALPLVAAMLAHRGMPTTVVCFPGQPGVPGEFSVARSCLLLRQHVERLGQPFLAAGLCSGAIAALAACSENPHARGVFAWDMAVDLQYSSRRVELLARRYRIAFAADAAEPVDALAFVPRVPAPILFAHPQRSHYTSAGEQRQLAAAAGAGATLCLSGVGHYPGEPRGSEQMFAQALWQWAKAIAEDVDEPGE